MAAGQAATSGVISAHVLALTEGVLKAMFHSKLKIAALALTLIAVIGVGMSGPAYPQQFPGAGGEGGVPQIEAKPRQGRPAWEYKALTRTAVEKLARESKNKLTDGLSVLGGEGWELVGIDQATATQGMAGGFGRFGGGGAGFGDGAPGGAIPGGAGAAPQGGGFRVAAASSTYVFKRQK
jgi:hypothetical protein